jgi:NhaP-type Na+/H+ or K+/H+ antiporter
MSSVLFSAGAIVIMAMLFIYMVIGSILEKVGTIIGHEASLLILVGMGISYVSYFFGHVDFNKSMSFDENFFFYFCLPPIVFASGYNMKRQKFFENFRNILLFGLFGTILQFTLFTVFTFIVVS